MVTGSSHLGQGLACLPFRTPGVVRVRVRVGYPDMAAKCHYEVLDVARDVGEDDLKKAYRKLALKVLCNSRHQGSELAHCLTSCAHAFAVAPRQESGRRGACDGGVQTDPERIRGAERSAGALVV